MQDEAEISISGVKLTHEESMTVRVAIDTLANVLAEGLEENETKALTDLYLTSLSRIQRLLWLALSQRTRATQPFRSPRCMRIAGSSTNRLNGWTVLTRSETRGCPRSKPIHC